jgi:hypothetical protein
MKHSEPHHDDPQPQPDPPEDARRVDLGRLLRALLDRNPIGQETIDRVLEILIRVLSRREFLERILRSEFMRHVRDMQVEITEAFGMASQGDVQDIKRRLDEVNQRLAALQKTLDEIVVEIDAA